MPSMLVSITSGMDRSDSATVGFVVANAALAAGQEVYIWLSLDGVNWSQQGYADGVITDGFKPLSELIQTFVSNGGRMVICPPCFRTRGLSEEKLYASSELAGGARLAEILGKGASSISY